MKRNTLALALAAAMAMGLAPAVHAQKPMDNVKAMDTDRDGMISKAEFLRMMEAKFDAMDKQKRGRLTPEDVARSIKEIGATYGYN